MTVKLQNGNVILKDGKVACDCCGCAYPFNLFTLLYASQRQINFGDTSRWPSDVTVSEWQQIANIDEEPIYEGSFAYPIVEVIRDQLNYRVDYRPTPGRIFNPNGSCARFVCASGPSINSMARFGGPTASGRDIRELILDYVPIGTWDEGNNFLFKIEFYGWFNKIRTQAAIPPYGGFFYRWREPSDTKFTIKYATFTVNP